MDDETRPPLNRANQIVDLNTGEVISSRKLDANSNFVMLFRDKMDVITKLITKSGTAAVVLFKLVEKMDRRNAIFMSQRTIGELCDLSPATVNRSLKVLIDSSIIKPIYVGNLVGYAVNANLAWTTHSNGRRYADLTASIVVSEGEQPPKKKPASRSIKVVTSKIEKGQQLIPGTENV